MRFAYADPPYPGQAKRLYGQHKDFAGEVDHRALVDRLVSEYPDGWALSTGSKWLQEILALCPPGVRVLAWVKPGAPPFRVRPQYTWEPVILRGGRPWAQGDARTTPDHLVGTTQLYTFRAKPVGWVVGSKPPKFARWIFACLGARNDDTLDDLFPGSGIIGSEWEAFTRQEVLAL